MHGDAQQHWNTDRKIEKAEEKLISAIIMHIYGTRVYHLKDEMHITEMVNICVLVAHLGVLDVDCESWDRIKISVESIGQITLGFLGC